MRAFEDSSYTTENKYDTSSTLLDIPVIQVGDHEIPVPAYLKIVELYQLGTTSHQMIEEILRHTKSSTRLVVADVVQGIIANEKCMGSRSNQMHIPSIGPKRHNSHEERRPRATIVSANHGTSALHRSSINRVRLRPASMGGLRRPSVTDSDGVLHERSAPKIQEIASRSPLQHLEAVASIAHSINRAHSKRSAVANEVQRLHSSQPKASRQASRVGLQPLTLQKLDLKGSTAQRKLDAATEVLQSNRARLKYLEQSPTIAAKSK